jgi:hypothetical protein
MQRRPERVALWCRIKRIGKSQPAIDAGYTILGILRWVEVDMLMPPCEDNEVIRDYAQEHGWVASNFGCSFFPTEPEHRITFQVSETNHQKSKQEMVSANLGGIEAHNVEYAADANGYICNMGWTSETRDKFAK